MTDFPDRLAYACFNVFYVGVSLMVILVGIVSATVPEGRDVAGEFVQETNAVGGAVIVLIGVGMLFATGSLRRFLGLTR